MIMPPDSLAWSTYRCSPIAYGLCVLVREPQQDARRELLRHRDDLVVREGVDNVSPGRLCRFLHVHADDVAVSAPVILHRDAPRRIAKNVSVYTRSATASVGDPGGYVGAKIAYGRIRALEDFY